MCLFALSATAAGVKTGSVETLVDSCGFFPQISTDGQWLLYSPTEGTSLMLKNLSTGIEKTVSNVGYPGFDAIFGGDGKVYYITQERKKNGLVYRTGHCYDPATGKDQIVLKPQHGRVQAIRATSGVVINGERQIYYSNGHVGAYAYTRGETLYVVDDNGNTRALQPVRDSNGYLWASLSPMRCPTLSTLPAVSMMNTATSATGGPRKTTSSSTSGHRSSSTTITALSRSAVIPSTVP